MVKRENRLLWTINQICVIGLFVFSLVSVMGTIGCSDSGGSSGKYQYSLKGYDGVVDDESSSIQSVVSGVGNDSLDFYAAFPWFVNLTFQVFDENSWGVSGLGIDDVSLVEDGIDVSKIDSEMNFRTRIALPSGYSYALKTVLFVDNTPSSPLPLENMIEAAQVVIDFIDEHQQQEIAIVAYDEAGDPTVIQDFTSNLTTLNTKLINLEPSYGTTNFYGAVRVSLALFDDNQSPAETEFVQGFVVAVTDGLDTSNLYDFNDAIAARKDKQVITVAVGEEMPQSTLDDLETLGNGGFYPVPEPDQAADEKAGKNPQDENLCEWMQVVQERMLAYADGFYWLQYRSSTTSKDTNLTHSVTLSLLDNRNDGEDSQISGTYSSEAFFSGDTSIYFNASASDPAGITEKVIVLERGQGTGEVAETLTALTYSQSGGNPSQYEWSSSDTSIVTIKADANDSSQAIVTVVGPGDVVLTVTDTVNNVTQTLTIKVKVREESFEMLQHVVTSKAPWFADATFQVRKTYDADDYDDENPWCNQWEWVADLAREDMTVLENGLKIDMEDSELHLHKRDYLPSGYSYVLKTVLLIDNSPSNVENLTFIKNAAKVFAKRALVNDPLDRTDLGPLKGGSGWFQHIQQQIAIVSYSEYGDTLLIQDFTTDLDTVNAAINSIDSGVGVIDFYSGMIQALNLCFIDNNPYYGNTFFSQGVVVVLSDGWQSNPGFYDRDAVLDETGDRQVICVGVGDDLVSENSDDLIAFGNAGFYSVPDPGNKTKVSLTSDSGKQVTDVFYTDLQQTLINIQDDAVYPYANSFYWLDYRSYLAPAVTCERAETMVATINNNSNTAVGNKVSGSFESCNYFEGIDGMIYVNSTVTNPDGLTGDIDLQYVMMGNFLLYSPTYTLEAFTYDSDGFKNTPAYEWDISSPFVIVTPVFNSYANSRVVLSLPEVKSPGSATLQINDSGNSVWKNIGVNVTELQLPGLVAYYPFDGNANDISGNGYDGVPKGNATLTTDRFGTSNSAYAFDGNQSYIAIQDFHYGGNSEAFPDTIDEITVCAWVKSTNPKSHIIMSFGWSDYWRLALQAEGDYNAGDTVLWRTADAGVKDALHSSNSNNGVKYNDGQWHFICAWFNSNADGDNKKIYVDGELVASANVHSGPIGTGVTRYGFIGAGSEASSFDNSVFPIEFFNGAIDDVLIVHNALTEDQMKTLFLLE